MLKWKDSMINLHTVRGNFLVWCYQQTRHLVLVKWQSGTLLVHTPHGAIDTTNEGSSREDLRNNFQIYSSSALTEHINSPTPAGFKQSGKRKILPSNLTLFLFHLLPENNLNVSLSRSALVSFLHCFSLPSLPDCLVNNSLSQRVVKFSFPHSLEAH